ncbi:hypothetical protein RN629_00985 [Sphingomonadaceae bacterium jetA1]|uniref:hypothetical protein n=1 Tax=Facivitalis istanbulensis TaxID=3075838 RepID=UPI00348C531E
MTVAAKPSTISYAEDGTSTVFAVPFRFKAASDLVVERLFGDQVLTLQLGTDYVVSGGQTDAGGTLIRNVSTNGAVLRITRSTALAQPMTYATGDRFPAASHEEALDRQMLIAQEQDARQADTASRALMLPPGAVADEIKPVPSSVIAFGGDKALTTLPIGSFPAGPTGPANSTYTTIDQLRGARVTDRSYQFAPDQFDFSGFPPGTYFFRPGDYSGAQYSNDFVSGAKVRLLAVDLTVGALVRQEADGLTALSLAPGAVPRSQQSKNDDMVSVLDFMFQADRVACRAYNPSLGWSATLPDVTYAFNRALAAAELVVVPAGGYKIADLRMLNRSQLLGDGRNATFLLQKNPTSRIIDCLSDASVGQLLGVKISGVSLLGCPNPVAAAVRVAGYGGYAITRSWFEFHAQNVAKFIEVQPGDTGPNVYDCDFHISGEQAFDNAVTCGGGVYQRWKLFLTRCEKFLAVMDFGHSFADIVGDGCIKIGGQGNYIRPSIEFIWATRLPEDNPGDPSTGIGAPSRVVMDLSQTIASHLDLPLLNTYASNVFQPDTRGVKFAIRPGQGLTITNLRFYGLGAIPHPIDPSSVGYFTVTNGTSNAANKMEAMFDEQDDGHSLRRVTFIGDTSSLASVPTGRNSLDPLYVAPAGPINLSVGMRYTSIIIDPSVASLDFVNFSIKSGQAPYHGWYLSITTTRPITAINWPADGRYTNLPTSLAGNSRFAMQFNATANKWFLA